METSINEYNEEMTVNIKHLDSKNIEHIESPEERLGEKLFNAYMERKYVVEAFNEGGYNSTWVDLLELLEFVKNKMPELWKEVK